MWRGLVQGPQLGQPNSPVVFGRLQMSCGGSTRTTALSFRAFSDGLGFGKKRGGEPDHAQHATSLQKKRPLQLQWLQFQVRARAEDGAEGPGLLQAVFNPAELHRRQGWASGNIGVA